MRWSIPINVVVSLGTFNTGLLPAEQSYFQQITALLMWGLLIYASGFVRPVVRLEFNPDMMAVVGLIDLPSVPFFGPICLPRPS